MPYCRLSSMHLKHLMVATMVLGGCGGGDGGGPSPTTVIAKTSGDAQDGIVGQALAKPIQVLVSESNAPVAGATVTWSTTLTGATLTPASGPTDGDGLASTQWTLGPFKGLQTATATVNGATTTSVNFTDSTNPAVDTLAVGGTVTWTWGNTGIAEHSVRSLGSPGFTSSATKLGNGQTYSVTFANAGTYSYDCAVHGSQMTGRIVVR